MKKLVISTLIVVVSIICLSTTGFTKGAGLSGGSPHTLTIGLNIPFYLGFHNHPGLELEFDIGIKNRFSVIPRIGNTFGVGGAYLNLGASFIFGIIAPNRPTGFGIGPSIDFVGLGSGYLGVLPGFEASYKYTFSFPLSIGGGLRFGIFLYDGVHILPSLAFKIGVAI